MSDRQPTDNGATATIVRDAHVDKPVKAGVWLQPEAEHLKAAAGQITIG